MSAATVCILLFKNTPLRQNSTDSECSADFCPKELVPPAALPMMDEELKSLEKESHKALNDRSPADAFMKRIPRTSASKGFNISKFILKNFLATGTTINMHDHRPSGMWTRGIFKT
ncbi:unnamed protein product [Rodentolepis nana]|uniref:Secreted protein n=1 Tax=Rodentolepis nana TaxID=102285 RepID=A0A0R3U064_RODNA|nr:unnamed protein product [Rodentolepis nana]